METSPGTWSCDIKLEFQETDTVFSRSFRSISPDSFIEVYLNVDSIVSTFTNRIQNSAGKATLKDVSITITDQPQIYHAEIEDVTGPDDIKRGTSATFSIVLVPHWSSSGEERTIEKEITLDIPDNFSIGSANLEVSGNTSSSLFGDFIFFDDFDFDLDDDDLENKIPKTLDDLIEQIEKEETDPSVIKITLESDDFGEDIEKELDLEGFIVTGSKTKFISIQSQ